MTNDVLLLGLDPGFANYGWCLAVCGPLGPLHVERMGVITTKKDQRKVLESLDTLRRQRAIAGELALLLQNGPSAICIESFSPPRHSGSASKVAMAYNTAVVLAHGWDLPVVLSSPQEIKESVSGKRTASKSAMAARLTAKYPECRELLGDVPDSKQEHPLDALGAIVAALDSDVIRALRR